MISGIDKITLATRDQDAARTFWTDRIGFEVTKDETYGDERWIEVTAPDGTTLVLAKGETAGDFGPPGLPTSNVFFTCEDLAATHRELVERGVEFHTEPTKMHFGWWSMFTDVDGTRFALTQSDTPGG